MEQSENEKQNKNRRASKIQYLFISTENMNVYSTILVIRQCIDDTATSPYNDTLKANTQIELYSVVNSIDPDMYRRDKNIGKQKCDNENQLKRRFFSSGAFSEKKFSPTECDCVKVACVVHEFTQMEYMYSSMNKRLYERSGAEMANQNHL